MQLGDDDLLEQAVGADVVVVDVGQSDVGVVHGAELVAKVDLLHPAGPILKGFPDKQRTEGKN